MKKIFLYCLCMSLFTWTYAQTAPQELSFEGKLVSIETHIIPLKFVESNGILSNILQYELTFSHELNPQNTLKIRVTYGHPNKVAIINEYPSGRTHRWDMKVGKIYHFQLTKACTNAQSLHFNDYEIYHYICEPQASDCSKVVFKTSNVPSPNGATTWCDLVVYQGHLYRFKMGYTNKNSHMLEQAGFRD